MATRILPNTQTSDSGIVLSLEYLISEADKFNDKSLSFILKVAKKIALRPASISEIEKTHQDVDEDTLKAAYFIAHYLRASEETQRETAETILKNNKSEG